MSDTPQIKKTKLSALGRGLSALLPKEIPTTNEARVASADDGSVNGGTLMIDLMKVRPNRFQPRKDFDRAALNELIESIKEKGIIQPVTVRRIAGGYELIAGERRVRASIEAGLEKIPAYILDISNDADMLELAIIENIQREDLNPIEVALGYRRLIDECNLTQEDVAAKVGKDRSTVTNFLRLLKLSNAVQESLQLKKISTGHARSLLSLGSDDLQEKVLADILGRELSVRATESLVRNIANGKISYDKKEKERAEKSGTNQASNNVSATLTDIEAQLRTIFATKVRVKTKSASGAGTIELDFYSIEDLERLLELFVIVEQSVMHGG